MYSWSRTEIKNGCIVVLTKEREREREREREEKKTHLPSIHLPCVGHVVVVVVPGFTCSFCLQRERERERERVRKRTSAHCLGKHLFSEDRSLQI
jgi:hypothetical protein